MNDGNVAAFACGRLHPQLGDMAPCVRQRHHAGDHRAENGGRLKVWADPATPFDVPPVKVLTDQGGTPLPADALDEHAETWTDPVLWQALRPASFGDVLTFAGAALTWLVVMAALVKYLVT